MRCFAHGKRVRLDESVFDGQPEHVLKAHRYYKKIRDKHIAHSVNPFEDFATGGRVDNLEEEPRLHSILMIAGNMDSGNPEEVENLEQLATQLLYVVMKRMEKAEKKLLAKANSLTPEELRRLPPLRMEIQQGYDAAGEKRR